MIEFGPEILTSVDASLEREWLETNGIGGFASSTIIGVNTRRYHGLLVAAMEPPAGRIVLLSKVEETLIVDGKHHDLGANQYPGVIYPRGFEFMTQFRLDPFPTFRFQIGPIEIEKRVFLVYGENTVVVEYEMFGGEPCTLDLRPLIAFRDFHSLTRRNSLLNGEISEHGDCVEIAPYFGMPVLYVAHNGAAIERTAEWYYNFEYAQERQRGLDYQEDLFNPCTAHFELRSGEVARLVISTRPVEASDAPVLRDRELARRHEVQSASLVDDSFIKQLTSAADQFIVRRGDWHTIIAGYHWFGDWGRDTMIALPGLTLATGRTELAKEILLAFTGALDQGMLPNRFPDSGAAIEYNSVDAALWLFEAVRSYLAATDDVEFVLRHMYPRLTEAVEWHLRGTRYGIVVDSDGLLSCGEPGVQLTWMDSKIDDWVVTPRHGKPVEIQALWYNALRVQEQLAGMAGDADMHVFFREMAEMARVSFNRQFWNENEGCLYDVVRRTVGTDRYVRTRSSRSACIIRFWTRDDGPTCWMW